MEVNKQKKNQTKRLNGDENSSIYSRCLLTRKVVLPISCIGKNLHKVIEEYIQQNFEGKCLVEGYIKQHSTKIINHSSGIIVRGSNVMFEVVFECNVFYPVEGMNISCSVKNITKAGVRAELANEYPSPVIAFIAKDHNFNSPQFNNVQVNDTINVRIIGQRFELNDKYVSVIGELVKERSYTQKPKLVINY
jgi:DNA-directed RNA polymerase subunit E'/Rpb7